MTNSADFDLSKEWKIHEISKPRILIWTETDMLTYYNILLKQVNDFKAGSISEIYPQTL